MQIVAHDYLTTAWVELELRDGTIESIGPWRGPDQIEGDDPWVAPAFWDIQLNGRGGHSFSSPELTALQAADIVRDQRPLGTGRLCPTLITAPVEHMLHGLRTIAETCDRFPDVARSVVGIHVEGPFLSER